MNVDKTPMRPAWSSIGDLIKRNQNEILIKPKKIITVLVTCTPAILGIGFVYNSILLLVSTKNTFFMVVPIVIMIFGLFCLFISYMVLHTLYFDLTLFTRDKEKIQIKRGRFSGSINRVLSFSDIVIFQTIKYRDGGHVHDDENRTTWYELNMVLSDNQRISLIRGSRRNIVKNAKILSSFTKKPVKIIKYGTY